MKVLVTGAAGFAGHHTVEHILQTMTDWTVVALDRRPMGRTFPGLEHRIERVVHDLLDPLPLDDPILRNVDAVINLASYADVDHFIAEPAVPTLANVTTTLRLLQWARGQRLSHFIQISSNEVYGSSHGVPTAEWAPISPSTPYSASKAAQEAAAIAWWHTYGVPVTLTNTIQLFGEGQPHNRLIPTAVRRLRAGLPVRVIGGADAERCWTYVRHHADALRWLLTRPVTPPCDGDRPDRWHIAGPRLRIEQVITKVAAVLEIEPLIEVSPPDEARAGHEASYLLDGTKIEVAGWDAPSDFDECFERTVRHIDKQQ